MDNHTCRVDDLAQIGRSRFGQSRSHGRHKFLAGGSCLAAANRCTCAIQDIPCDVCQAWIWLLTLFLACLIHGGAPTEPFNGWQSSKALLLMCARFVA